MIPDGDPFKENDILPDELNEEKGGKLADKTISAEDLKEKQRQSIFKKMRSSMSVDEARPQKNNAGEKKIMFKDEPEARASKQEAKIPETGVTRPVYVRPSLSKLALIRSGVDAQLSPTNKRNGSSSQISTPTSSVHKRVSQANARINENSIKRLNSIFNPAAMKRAPSLINIEDIEKEELRIQVMKKLVDNKKVEFLHLVKSSIEEDFALSSARNNDPAVAGEEKPEVLYTDETDNDPIAKEFAALVEKEDTENEDLYCIEPKNSVELLRMYVDPYPLLHLRKRILMIFKKISVLCRKIITHQVFEYCTLLCIVMNSILLALEDPKEETTDPVRQNFEDAFLIIYSLEMVLKISALGFVFNKGAYLRDAWNILDFVIVVTAYLPLILSKDSGVNLSSLRSLRVLRPLRTISSIKNLKVLLRTLFSALPLLMDTIMILMFFFIVFAIAGVQLFSGTLKKRCISEELGKPHPLDLICGGVDCPSGFFCAKMFDNPNYGIVSFDNLLFSFLMIFQCVTMEGWSEIMISLIKAFNLLSVVYFVLVVFIGSFFLLNLTLAVIKAKFTESLGKEEDKSVKPIANGFDIHIYKLVRRYQRSYRKTTEKKLKQENRTRVGAQWSLEPNEGRHNFVLFEEEVKKEIESKRKASQRRPRRTTIRNSKRGSIKIDNFHVIRSHQAGEHHFKSATPKRLGFFKVPSGGDVKSNIKFMDVKLVPKKIILPPIESPKENKLHKKSSLLFMNETIRNKPLGALAMRASRINTEFSLPENSEIQETTAEYFIDEEDEFLSRLEHKKEAEKKKGPREEEDSTVAVSMLLSKKKSVYAPKATIAEDSFEVSEDEGETAKETEPRIYPLELANLRRGDSRKIRGPRGKTFLVEKNLLDDSDFLPSQGPEKLPVKDSKLKEETVDPFAFEDSFRDSHRQLIPPLNQRSPLSKIHSPRVYPETYFSTDSVKEEVMTDIPADNLASHRETLSSLNKVKPENMEDGERTPLTRRGRESILNKRSKPKSRIKKHLLSAVFKKPNISVIEHKPKTTLAENFRSLTKWFLGFKNCFSNSNDALTDQPTKELGAMVRNLIYPENPIYTEFNN